MRTEQRKFLQKPKKNEKYLYVYHLCKSRSYQDGGIVVFSLKMNAVQRWLLTAHSRALFVDKCRMMAGNKEEDRLHEEAGKSQMKRDEEDVRKVMEVVSNWTDPFEPSENLPVLLLVV